MGLDSIVDVSITTLTASIAKASFDTPLCAAYFPTTVFPERVRLYTSQAAMITDGFAATDPAYLMVTALKAQNPSIKTWKIGRKALPSQQTFALTPTITTEGEILRVTVEGTEIAYTILGSATVNTIATALQILIDAITGVTAVDSTGFVTITPTTTNDLLSIGGISTGFTIKDNTPDPGITTDLAAIEAEDAGWYGLNLDSESETEILAAAAWVEARKILFIPSSIDSDKKPAGTTTDVGSDLQAAAYARTGLIHAEFNQQYVGARWMGKMFPKNPGQATWAYKSLAGATVSVLTGSDEAGLDGKNVNHYTTVAGVNITQKGYSASGEFLDTTRGVDWFSSRLQERVFALFVLNEKLDYSDATGDLFRAEILAQLQEGQSRSVIAPNTEATPWVISVPLAADQTAVDKGNRHFPGIEFSAFLAGAVHTVEISGVLSL